MRDLLNKLLEMIGPIVKLILGHKQRADIVTHRSRVDQKGIINLAGHGNVVQGNTIITGVQKKLPHGQPFVVTPIRRGAYLYAEVCNLVGAVSNFVASLNYLEGGQHQVQRISQFYPSYDQIGIHSRPITILKSGESVYLNLPLCVDDERTTLQLTGVVVDSGEEIDFHQEVIYPSKIY